MSGDGNERGLDAPDLRDEPRPAHEPVPGPFTPGPIEPGGPYEWLTPQRSRPNPIHRDFTPEQAAS